MTSVHKNSLPHASSTDAHTHSNTKTQTALLGATRTQTDTLVAGGQHSSTHINTLLLSHESENNNNKRLDRGTQLKNPTSERTHTTHTRQLTAATPTLCPSCARVGCHDRVTAAQAVGTGDHSVKGERCCCCCRWWCRCVRQRDRTGRWGAVRPHCTAAAQTRRHRHRQPHRHYQYQNHQPRCCLCCHHHRCCCCCCGGGSGGGDSVSG